MTHDIENRELRERLVLMESMIAEGRKMTGNWGWAFILWGVAYYLAFAWSFLGWNAAFAWPGHNGCSGRHHGHCLHPHVARSSADGSCPGDLFHLAGH